jgi:hypothetical protein
MQIQNTNAQRMTRWLWSLLFGPGAPQDVIDINLYHAGLDDAQRLLRNWKVEASPEKEQCHELVDEIDREAAQDAEQLGYGMQRYQVRAFIKGSREVGSLTLKYAPNPVGGELMSFADSEPSNTRGQLAMFMRHTDGAYRLLAAGYAQMNDTFTRRLGQQDELFERMSQNQMKVFEVMQELAEKKLERDVALDQQRRLSELETLKETKKIEQSAMLWNYGLSQVAPLIPNLLNKLLRKDILPETTTPQDMMLSNFFQSVSPEQLANMQKILHPEQIASLFSIHENLERKHAGTAMASDPPADGHLSGEGLRAALRTVIELLLPWAAARAKAGESLDPTSAMPAETQLVKQLVKSLSPEDFQLLVTSDQILHAEERKLFVMIAEILGVIPAGPQKAV